MSASFSLARTCLLVLLGSAAICPGVNAAPPASASSASAREVATKAKLGAVRAEIAKIADAQHATATKRDAINAKLAAQATQLNQAANAVRESDTAIAAKAASLADLEQQRAALEQKLSGQCAARADLPRGLHPQPRHRPRDAAWRRRHREDRPRAGVVPLLPARPRRAHSRAARRSRATR